MVLLFMGIAFTFRHAGWLSYGWFSMLLLYAEWDLWSTNRCLDNEVYGFHPNKRMYRLLFTSLTFS